MMKSPRYLPDFFEDPPLVDHADSESPLFMTSLSRSRSTA